MYIYSLNVSKYQINTNTILMKMSFRIPTELKTKNLSVSDYDSQ